MESAPPPYDAAYPPQQPGYPPQQPGYPPQQPGYPPLQPGYPQPQPGYPPQPGYQENPYPQPGYAPKGCAPAPASTIVVNQPTIVLQTCVFREHPVTLTCPHCNHQILTSTHYVMGALAWILVFLLCFFCFIVAWLPCVIGGCQDVRHTCPNCHRMVGRYSRL